MNRLARIGLAMVGSILLLFGAVVWNAAFSQDFPYGCGPSAQRFAEYLERDHGEKPLWQGTEDTSNEQSPETHGARIVGYANPDTGTWTVVVITKAMVCIVKTGTDFKPAEKTLGPEL